MNIRKWVRSNRAAATIKSFRWRDIDRAVTGYLIELEEEKLGCWVCGAVKVENYSAVCPGKINDENEV